MKKFVKFIKKRLILAELYNLECSMMLFEISFKEYSIDKEILESRLNLL